VVDHVHVVGVGADGPASAPDVPSAPALVVASTRLAALARDRWPAATHAPFGPLDEILRTIEATAGEVVVLASGDPGWLGIARTVRRAVGADRVTWYPAPSSVASAFARAGVVWDDARVVSAHGRDPHAAIAVACAHPKVAVLTAPSHPPTRLLEAIRDAGCGPREVVVVERLGHDDERVRRGTLADPDAFADAADPNVVLLLAPDRGHGHRVTLAPPTDVPDGWALPTDAFVHRDGQVSKPEVRAMVLAHLAPRPGQVVWDVGAGSGAVAVECARFGAAVHAIERDAGQVQRVLTNAAEHDVAVRVVHGTAPDALVDLPAPDAAFVGGGGRDLAAICDVLVAAARPGARVVVALATVERVGPVADRLAAAGWDSSTSLVQVADLRPLGDGHRLAPRNPVFLVLAKAPR
jgi:precorrin-6B C5,15-methyltransferase / cobalt-precorrin-6B C5,C15-methyltransferase